MNVIDIDTIVLAKGTGLCACGCGQRAPLIRRTNTQKGHRKGQPHRYVSGHNKRGTTDLSRYTLRRRAPRPTHRRDASDPPRRARRRGLARGRWIP